MNNKQTQKVKEEFYFGRVQCGLCIHCTDYRNGYCCHKRKSIDQEIWHRCKSFEFRVKKLEFICTTYEDNIKVTMKKNTTEKTKQKLRNFIRLFRKKFGVKQKIDVFSE